MTLAYNMGVACPGWKRPETSQTIETASYALAAWFNHTNLWCDICEKKLMNTSDMQIGKYVKNSTKSIRSKCNQS